MSAKKLVADIEYAGREISARAREKRGYRSRLYGHILVLQKRNRKEGN